MENVGIIWSWNLASRKKFNNDGYWCKKTGLPQVPVWRIIGVKRFSDKNLILFNLLFICEIHSFLRFDKWCAIKKNFKFQFYTEKNNKWKKLIHVRCLWSSTKIINIHSDVVSNVKTPPTLTTISTIEQSVIVRKCVCALFLLVFSCSKCACFPLKFEVVTSNAKNNTNTWYNLLYVYIVRVFQSNRSNSKFSM